MAEPTVERQPPEGFAPSRGRGPFSTRNGPFYDRRTEAGVERGLFVLDRHCNSFGLMHGGMIATFLDGLLAAQAHHASGQVGVTVQLSIDYLRMAREGEWLQGDAHATRKAGELVFVEGRVFTPAGDVARAHAIFKLMSRKRAV